MIKSDVNKSLFLLDGRRNSSKIQSCNFLEIIAVILTFAKDELFNGEQLALPKLWNVFKWIRLARFLVDVVRIIVSCINGKPLDEKELSNAFIKTATFRDFDCQNRTGECLDKLNVV